MLRPRLVERLPSESRANTMAAGKTRQIPPMPKACSQRAPKQRLKAKHVRTMDAIPKNSICHSNALTRLSSTSCAPSRCPRLVGRHIMKFMGGFCMKSVEVSIALRPKIWKSAVVTAVPIHSGM